jgi:hypothetical protein
MSIIFRSILAVALTFVAATAETQVNRDDILYLLPEWSGLATSDDATIDQQIGQLRQRLGPEGPYLKLGFTSYVDVTMNDWNVNLSDSAAVRAALGGTIAYIDNLIARARTHNFPIALNVVTAARDLYDPVQRASEAEDVRSMQWYSDNVMAPGWWTHSRYARKQLAVQEAYIRELGKTLANRMSLYPDTLVAASGDGEVELAFARAPQIYADYSPFAVAEFRDWIRHGGLYADGALYSGQGYALGIRYAGDRTPGEDTNNDGHTLNGDFGTSFNAWNLRHFDWSLNDTYAAADPHAIPLTAYSSSSFVPLPGEISQGFDAPRVPQPLKANPWWDLWVLFKQTMLQRHNQEFAKWITTSADPGTGATVPAARWYSYQIPADYLFNGTPDLPNERWHSSMSSWWTADISPYGSLGITAFNIEFPTFVAYTLKNVAPVIAARDLRWGVLEWHPGVLPGSPGASTSLELYRSEMAVVEQYRPSLLVPIAWDHGSYPIRDTGFETALREMVAHVKNGTPSDVRLSIDQPIRSTVTLPFDLTGWSVDLGKIRGPGRGPGVDRVEVYAYPNPGSGEAPIFLGAAAYGSARSDVADNFGAQFKNSGYAITVRSLPPGAYDLVVNARSTVTQTFGATQKISVNIVYPLTFSPSTLRFGATKAGAAGALASMTPGQVVTPSYGGPGVPSWTATTDQPWLQITNGPSVGQFTVGIVNPNNVIGASKSLSATLTVAAANLGVSGTVPVTLTVENTGVGALPFGSFDTPIEGATGLSGSIAVTGWALDDVGIDRVEIWRDLVAGETTPPYPGPGLGHGKVFIANGLFINGARPDVEGAFPNNPEAYRAGWGYLMLTHGLWGRGNGTYKLYAFAYDKDGHSATLGTKTIQVSNDTSLKPFGALDTPNFGTTVSGGYWNFGWALTPNAPDGTTCSIVNGNVFIGIDSGPLIPVQYGDLRSDIAAQFSGFSNGQNAGGAHYIDTTTLSNGTHQIGWLVIDSCGRSDGIGSRFFNVLNTAGSAAAASPAARAPDASTGARWEWDPIRVQRAGGRSSWSYPNDEGVHVVRLGEGERVELQLPMVHGGNYRGFEVVNGVRRALPLGSSLDGQSGVFYWQPAAGFLGSHDLEFEVDYDFESTVVLARAAIGPPVRMSVDAPLAGSTLSSSFVIAGWALDLAAERGSGVDAVHVWAYPVGTAGAPTFLGAAEIGGSREDVGQVFGGSFRRSGYHLTASGLAPGAYDLVIYARRAGSGTFHNAERVRVQVK